MMRSVSQREEYSKIVHKTKHSQKMSLRDIQPPYYQERTIGFKNYVQEAVI